MLQRDPCTLGTVHNVNKVTHDVGWLQRQLTDMWPLEPSWLCGTVATLLSEAVAPTPHTQPFQGDGCVLALMLPDFFLSVVQTHLGFGNWQVV